MLSFMLTCLSSLGYTVKHTTPAMDPRHSVHHTAAFQDDVAQSSAPAPWHFRGSPYNSMPRSVGSAGSKKLKTKSSVKALEPLMVDLC